MNSIALDFMKLHTFIPHKRPKMIIEMMSDLGVPRNLFTKILTLFL